MGLQWPLVGRVEELEFIDRVTWSPDGPAGVVLAGSAGVGTTRLAREAVTRLGERGATPRWAVGTSSARSVPLGAFVGMIRGRARDRSQVVRNAVDELLEGPGQRGVVVAVDDAHELDEVSALVLHQLVLSRGAAVVATVRTGEPAPDAVTALRKDEHLARLEVQPLSEPEVGVLLEAVLGGPVEGATARSVWNLTNGNVLFLKQLVDGELAADRLREVKGIWRWSRGG